MICPLMSWRSTKEKACLEKTCALWTGCNCTLNTAQQPPVPAGVSLVSPIGSEINKPSTRRIEGTNEYRCEHKDKNEINGDCVWCALSVAETGLVKQRELRLKAEAAAKPTGQGHDVDKFYPPDDEEKKTTRLVPETAPVANKEKEAKDASPVPEVPRSGSDTGVLGTDSGATTTGSAKA